VNFHKNVEVDRASKKTKSIKREVCNNDEAKPQVEEENKKRKMEEKEVPKKKETRTKQ
jgi:hypothetical protein